MTNTFPMKLLWRKIFQIPQTYLLLVGILLGLSIFLSWVGIRLFTVILGGLISLVMLGFWIKYLSSIFSQSRANLLELDSFLQQSPLNWDKNLLSLGAKQKPMARKVSNFVKPSSNEKAPSLPN
jgi:hypothetical protein